MRNTDQVMDKLLRIFLLGSVHTGGKRKWRFLWYLTRFCQRCIARDFPPVFVNDQWKAPLKVHLHPSENENFLDVLNFSLILCCFRFSLCSMLMRPKPYSHWTKLNLEAIPCVLGNKAKEVSISPSLYYHSVWKRFGDQEKCSLSRSLWLDVNSSLRPIHITRKRKRSKKKRRTSKKIFAFAKSFVQCDRTPERIRFVFALVLERCEQAFKHIGFVSINRTADWALTGALWETNWPGALRSISLVYRLLIARREKAEVTVIRSRHEAFRHGGLNSV